MYKVEMKAFHVKIIVFILCYIPIGLNAHAHELFSDIFKPISIHYLHTLFDNAQPEKQQELNEMFQVKKIYNGQSKKKKKLVAYSLFGKLLMLIGHNRLLLRKIFTRSCNFHAKNVLFLRNTSIPRMVSIPSLQLSREADRSHLSPIMASFFGAKNIGNMNMEKAMKGFILHWQLFPDEPRHPRDVSYNGYPYGFGNEFPSYGFDERFLKHVIYFEAASKGQLSYLPLSHDKAKRALLDILTAPPENLIFKDYAFIGLYNPHSLYGMK